MKTEEEDNFANIQKPDTLNLNALHENDLSSTDALKLSPRKTEREKKNVNYANLNRGTGLNPIEEDDDDNKLKKQDSKKTGNHLEVQRKVQEMFDSLKDHEHSMLFNKFLDKNHSMYNEVKDVYTTLELLILQFQTGDKFYKNTDEIATDIRKMIQTMMKMSM
jgi:hypothetical protein